MNHCTSCGGAGVETCLVPEYKALGLGAPFTVILHDAVKVESCAKCGRTLGTYVPDMEGLFHAVAFSRALEPRKLADAEIKFIRKAMGWKAKDVAKTLGISAAHLSRCETGEKVFSPATEKLFRLCAVLRTPDRSARDELDISIVLDLIEVNPTWDAKLPLVFHFVRRPVTAKRPSDTDDKWRKEAA